jgi:ribosome-binding protein aMBF1 (putative translation factor)
MLAVVKAPHIEISLNGEGTREALNWLSRKFKVMVISRDDKFGESVPVEETDFWKEMQSNRIGNLLEASRIKAELTQKQVAEAVGIKQNMVSEYESGKRRLSKKMAQRLSAVLGIKSARLK